VGSALGFGLNDLAATPVPMLTVDGLLTLTDDVTVDIFDSGGLEAGDYYLVGYQGLDMGAYDFLLGQTPAGFDFVLDPHGVMVLGGGQPLPPQSNAVVLHVTSQAQQVIPEPVTLLAVLAGAGALGGYIRRRRRA
jgi:hypothetical protein